MYEVDNKDLVVELGDIPRSSIGAPIPIVLADERDVLVTYYLDTSEDWDGETIRSVGPDTEGEPVAVVKFKFCTAHMFGPPNDEAFAGHPLAQRGLHPYGAFEVKCSSWIRRLERMNSVHPYHDKKRFLDGRRHFVLSFHDTTFECIANGYTFETGVGSVNSMVPRMLELLK